MFFDWLFFIISKLVFFTSAIGNKNTFPSPLSSEDEAKYLKLAKQGDEEAKEILIKHNLRLVAHIVKKYNNAAETDDLISVGSIGLIKAINTYEMDKGTQLATYTARCIENEILMLLRSNKKYKNNISLSEPVGVDKDGNELTLMDLLFDKEDGVFQQVEMNILNEKFMKIMEQVLSDREYKIVCLRYGLKNKKPLAQREVAALLKISRSYISRIEKKAIEKIREALKKNDFFLE